MTQINKIKTVYRTLTREEEIFNSITHGLGTILSVAGLIILTASAVNKGNIWHIVSYSIFGHSMVLLYL